MVDIDQMVMLTVLLTVFTWSLLIAIVVIVFLRSRRDENPGGGRVMSLGRGGIFNKFIEIVERVTRMESSFEQGNKRLLAQVQGVLDKVTENVSRLFEQQGRGFYYLVLDQIFIDISSLNKQDYDKLGVQVRKLESVVKAMRGGGYWDKESRERVFSFLDSMKKKWEKDEDMMEVFAMEQSSLESVAVARSSRRPSQAPFVPRQVFVIEDEERREEGEKGARAVRRKPKRKAREEKMKRGKKKKRVGKKERILKKKEAKEEKKKRVKKAGWLARLGGKR